MKSFGFTSFFEKSMSVGRLFGIPIRLHITILFFLYPALTSSRLGFWNSIEYAIGIVLSILVHELGHALTAKRFGMHGLSITLHGFGGFASSSGARTPRQQLYIVLAGPGATFALGITLLLVAFAGRGGGSQFYLVALLGVVNIILGFLNLFPVLPWDGGQALQAIFAHRVSEFKAMRRAAHIGLVVAPLMFVLGYLAGTSLFFVFALIGVLTCYTTLANSGGIRFREAAEDRRRIKDIEAVKRREAARQDEYLGEVNLREKEREERERLKRLFKVSGMDDEPPKS